jgi:hypothetical protein
MENKAKKEKCFNCKKKCGIIKHICRCYNNFCIKCRLPEAHECTFDFTNKNELEKKLVKVDHDKIIKI